MSLANIEKIIMERFANNWTATDIEYQNTEYQANRTDPFVKITVIPGNENIIGFGGDSNKLYRTVGVVFFGIFVPVDTGTRLALIYADQIAAIFRGIEDQGVIFRNIEINEVGELSGWFQFNLSIDFESDEIH